MDLAIRCDMMKFSQGMGNMYERSGAWRVRDPAESIRRTCESARLACETAKSTLLAQLDDDGRLKGDMDEAMAAAEAMFGMAQMLAVESFAAGRAIALEKARRDKAKRAAGQSRSRAQGRRR